MTPRQRLLCALNLGKPDRVPVSPDITMLYPARYSGKPYWEVLYNNNPPVWRMIADLAGRFGFDAMIQVALDQSAAEEEMESVKVIETTKDYRLVEYSYRTAKGPLKVTLPRVHPESLSITRPRTAS